MERSELRELCEGFAARRPDLAASALVPGAARNKCEVWSRAFMEWVALRGRDCGLVNLVGYLGEFPRHAWRGEGVAQDWSSYEHVVLSVGGWYVDWSRRQMDDSAPVPFVQAAAEANAEWGRRETWPPQGRSYTNPERAIHNEQRNSAADGRD